MYFQSKQKYRQKMADTQDMTEAITQAAIEAAKVTVQAVAMARAEVGYVLRSESMGMVPKLSGPTLKQPTFYWNFTDTYP